jgi:hypothetical protein
MSPKVRKRPDVRNLILQAMEPEREHRGATKEERADRGDNVTSTRGNSALYTLKRLKRDRPDRAQAEHRSQGTRTDILHAVSMKLNQGSTQAAYLLRRSARAARRPAQVARRNHRTRRQAGA